MKQIEDIIENATVSFKTGGKQLFDAIKIVKNGIYIGQFHTENDSTIRFEEHSFIPHDQIEKITVCTDHGKTRIIEI